MKNRRIPFLLLLVLFIATAPLAAAQNKANVSGTWKMNKEKSKFERGGPQAITIKFDQQATSLRESLTVTNDGGDRTVDVTYTLDGKESPQQFGGQEIKASAKWEGEALVLEFKNSEGFSFLRKITLSSDGKTMTINVTQTNSNGSANDTVVLDKQ